jgi:hypothetical protein
MAAKRISGGSADAMVSAIHDRIHAQNAERGTVWCGHWGHPGADNPTASREADRMGRGRVRGQVCVACVHDHVAWVHFWRTMGVRDPEREM